MSTPPTVGIDFGTSKTVIAYHDGNSAQVISSLDKRRAIPSVVFFKDGGERLIGSAATIEGKDKPEFCLRHVKRLFGEKFRDGEDNGWQSVKGPDGMVWLRGPDRDYSPTEIAGFIIKEALDQAQFRLRGVRPVKAVLTFPAHYTPAQKACVIEAGKFAGLEQVYLLEEPVAAGVAYGMEQDKIRTLTVFDMGAGTCDFTVLVGGKTGGRIYLEPKEWDALPKGGVDADYEIVDWLTDKYYEKHSVDLGQDGDAIARLRLAAENAKITLSTKDSAHISVPLIEYTPPRSLDETLELAHFEEMLKPLTEEAIAVCQRVLDKAGLTKANITEWILVGGMTNVPAIHKAITDFAGKEPRADIDPDEVVAIGAATHAAANIDMRIRPYNLVKKVDLDFGFEASGDVFHKVIKRGTLYPVKETIDVKSEEDNQPELSIHVLEGEGLEASGASRIAAVDIPVAPAPKGEARVTLTFNIDENGMSSVSHPDGIIYEGGVNA